MCFVLFLKFEHLVGWLLSEQLDSDLLILHCHFSRLPQLFPLHRVPHASRPVFIFLDRSDKLVSSFDIYLPSFHDLLKNLGVLLGEHLHLPLLIVFVPTSSDLLQHVLVVASDVSPNSFPSVKGLDLLQALVVASHVP